ncbi:MAG: Crp/Fnr family transcriptional regulator [Bacteroidetes bacterium]|nr:Crp/Fnr family transcriptional regulator [Bacteroidota bacterium]
MLTEQKARELFPDFDKELVDELLEHASVKTFHEGDTLMKTGQLFRSIIIVVSGSVKIFREDEEGDEYFMYYLQPGQACALSMICAARHQASELKAEAATGTEVITVPLEYMDKWMKTYKSWYYFVLENYRNRFQELLSTIDHVVFRNMDERLLFYLKKQQESTGSDILVVNNTTIAQELNSSREVVSRLMKKLAENGMIRTLSNQKIQVLDLHLN